MNEELASQVTDLVNQILEQKGFSAFATPFHTHTTTDAGQLDASKALINSPQPYILPLENPTYGTLSTGGSQPLMTTDSTAISIIQAQQVATKAVVNNILSELKIIGLIKNK